VWADGGGSGVWNAAVAAATAAPEAAAAAPDTAAQRLTDDLTTAFITYTEDFAEAHANFLEEIGNAFIDGESTLPWLMLVGGVLYLVKTFGFPTLYLPGPYLHGRRKRSLSDPNDGLALHASKVLGYIDKMRQLFPN